MIIIEMPNFTKLITDCMSDDDYSEVQRHLAERPDAGDLIPKTGGLRKLRWAGSGRGKRGGLRFIYYWVTNDDQIIMVTVYKKSDTDDLTKKQYDDLRKELEDEE